MYGQIKLSTCSCVEVQVTFDFYFFTKQLDTVYCTLYLPLGVMVLFQCPIGIAEGDFRFALRLSVSPLSHTLYI